LSGLNERSVSVAGNRQSLWLAGMWHATGLQATGAELRYFMKMASTFKRLVIWRYVFLFFGYRNLVKG